MLNEENHLQNSNHHYPPPLLRLPQEKVEPIDVPSGPRTDRSSSCCTPAGAWPSVTGTSLFEELEVALEHAPKNEYRFNLVV